MGSLVEQALRNRRTSTFTDLKMIRAFLLSFGWVVTLLEAVPKDMTEPASLVEHQNLPFCYHSTSLMVLD